MSRSRCSTAVPSGLLIFRYKRQSSAKRRDLDFIYTGRSLMYTRKIMTNREQSLEALRMLPEPNLTSLPLQPLAGLCCPGKTDSKTKSDHDIQRDVQTILWHFVKCLRGEKEGDLTQSYDQNPYTNRKFENQMNHTKTPPKTSITQRLRTDLRRSIGVTTVISLVWLNRFNSRRMASILLLSSIPLART